MLADDDADPQLAKEARPERTTAERLLRDRLPAGLGDLHPDHGPHPTADFNAPPLHDGMPLNHQPCQLINREAVGQ
jgi:hypothetical protein